MGTKGDKNTDVSNDYLELLRNKLEPIGGISTKKMFGGHGIFHNGKMFGIVDSKGVGYLKGDVDTKAALDLMGSRQHSKMPYFSIPESIFENTGELLNWATKAIEYSK